MTENANTNSGQELRDRVQARQWYHTLELAPGITTPGWFDCRDVAKTILPQQTEGLRCLDIATFDGFWAFEMERRGAAEVVAVDILDESRWDWPAGDIGESRDAIAQRKGEGDGFLLAKEALGSGVDRLDCSIYDLDSEVHGTFDIVYLGALLLHLRDPVGALMRVRGVCSSLLISTDAVHGRLHALVSRRPAASLDGVGRPYWWKPNLAGFRRMVEAAGFEVVAGPRRINMPPGEGHPRPPISPRLMLESEARSTVLDSRLGNPHAWLHARPAIAGSSPQLDRVRL